ncbi:MAG TPA: FAD-dependent oxidoreductase [Baekduia sp.]|jgi:NADPH-dependent 2,4-dienoyl-CoA reductase/sulfur reductase-like enzyme
MSRVDLLIVGGGPAAHATATGYRAAGGAGSVVLLAQEGRAPYRRPPLTKDLLRGETEPGALALEESAGWYDAQGISVRAARATALDPAARTVSTDGGETIAFGHCVLATGAAPVRPPIPGAERPGVQLLRTVEQAMQLRAAARPGARMLVLGSGFIGCEAAVSLRARGCAVALVSQEPAPQQARLGAAVAERLAGWLDEAGVEARYGREVVRIEEDGAALRAVLDDGAALTVDHVLLAGGVRPLSDLAQQAGLALADGGEIPAGASMRTAAPFVLACGDCCRAEHAVAGRPLHVEHWGDALAQGEVAGWTAAGRDAAWDTVPGFWSTIGQRTLKYAAWGDGFDDVRLVEKGDGAFTAWYGREGVCVGVLTHDFDPDYEAGRRLIERGERRP